MGTCHPMATLEYIDSVTSLPQIRLYKVELYKVYDKILFGFRKYSIDFEKQTRSLGAAHRRPANGRGVVLKLRTFPDGGRGVGL